MGKAFDYKKEYRDLYEPGLEPKIVELPTMKFVMIDGEGGPEGNPEFESAVELLYGVAFTIKMSPKKGRGSEEYFEYVVPPLKACGGSKAEVFLSRTSTIGCGRS
ncbi:MAG: hypothetical protein ACPLPR_05855 [Bacillota bacterium]